jgi:hypothetical protein
LSDPESPIENWSTEQLEELHAVLVEGVDEARKELKKRRVQEQLEVTLS